MVVVFLLGLIHNSGFWGRIWTLCYTFANYFGRTGRRVLAGLRRIAYERKAVENTPDLGEVEKGLGEGPGEPEETPQAEEEEEEEEEEDDDDDEEEEEDDDDDEEDDPKYRVETTDEFYCEYDSTWDTEEDTMPTTGSNPSRSNKFHTFQRAAKDLQNYRHGYEVTLFKLGITRYHWMQTGANLDEKPNLKFYCGAIPSSPDGVYISQFHADWHGQYDLLESVHSYIQWLFPLEEPGMNPEARTLTKTEIQDFLHNEVARDNLLKSYKLMLDFYGIRLSNEVTGELTRASNWRERFENMNRYTHNNLRITRILKCLGTLGFPHYQAPLVRFFLEQTLVKNELHRVKDSVLNYFLFAVLDRKQRRQLVKFAYEKHDWTQEFVWCPRKIQSIWSGEE